MVRTFPSILGLSTENNIEPKLAWLRENLDLDEEVLLVLVKVTIAKPMLSFVELSSYSGAKVAVVLFCSFAARRF